MNSVLGIRAPKMINNYNSLNVTYSSDSLIMYHMNKIKGFIKLYVQSTLLRLLAKSIHLLLLNTALPDRFGVAIHLRKENNAILLYHTRFQKP